MSTDFIDYYEVLEVSTNASSDTIEKLFRYLARRYHPDTGVDGGDSKKMALMIEAYNTLKDPDSRIAYDARYERFMSEKSQLISDAQSTGTDTETRHRILAIFYAKRKRDMKRPGVSPMSIGQMLNLPDEVLEFHLWYIRQKGWIDRDDSGLMAITIDGIDEIEKRNIAEVGEGNKLLAYVPAVDPFGGTKVRRQVDGKTRTAETAQPTSV